jgi:hypothetical protein
MLSQKSVLALVALCGAATIMASPAEAGRRRCGGRRAGYSYNSYSRPMAYYTTTQSATMSTQSAPTAAPVAPAAPDAPEPGAAPEPVTPPAPPMTSNGSRVQQYRSAYQDQINAGAIVQPAPAVGYSAPVMPRTSNNFSEFAAYRHSLGKP